MLLLSIDSSIDSLICLFPCSFIQCMPTMCWATLEAENSEKRSQSLPSLSSQSGVGDRQVNRNPQHSLLGPGKERSPGHSGSPDSRKFTCSPINIFIDA